MPDVPLHQHDLRYFTQQEIKLRLKDKSDAGHAHTHDDVTDFDTAAGALITSHEGEADPHAGYLLESGASVGASSQPQRLTLNLVTPFTDSPLQSATEGQEFNDNTAGFPAGWTEVTAPAARNTSRRYGFFWIQGGGTSLAWKYRKQAIGIVTAGSSYQSFEYGPIFWRQYAYTGDVTYRFGIYRDNGGAIDEGVYLRLALCYTVADGLWSLRSERNAGGGETVSAWSALVGNPLVQPLFVRLIVRAATQETRVSYGMFRWAETHRRIDEANMAVLWGAPWWQLEMSRAATSGSDYLFLGGIDKSGNA